MLHKFDAEEHGIVEVVDPRELFDRTSRGWRVLAILEAEVVVSKEEEVAPPPPPPPEPNVYPSNTYAPSINPTYARHFTETHFTYVLAQPKDQRIEELVAERDEAMGERQTQGSRADELESEVANLRKQVRGQTTIEDKLEKDLAAALGAVEEANAKADEAEKKRKAAITAMNKATKLYQGQMEILWNELGAAKMRELLGHDVESPIPLPKPKTAMERIADDDTP